MAILKAIFFRNYYIKSKQMAVLKVREAFDLCVNKTSGIDFAGLCTTDFQVLHTAAYFERAKAMHSVEFSNALTH